MIPIRAWSAALAAVLGVAASGAQAALTSYSAGGVGLVYSSAANVTWTKDANLLGSMIAAQGYTSVVNAILAAVPSVSDTPNAYDTPSQSGVHTMSVADFSASTPGWVSWFGAQAFAGYLNSIAYAGSTQWRMPLAPAAPQYGYNQTGGELGKLFYTELGGFLGIAIPNTASFDNEQAYVYWTSSERAGSALEAWNFFTVNGYQDASGKPGTYYAWAVTPGQVSPPAVPLPAGVWLMGSGLLGLVCMRRRRPERG